VKRPALFAATGLAAALSAYALGVEPYRLQLTQPTLWLPTLPPALDGLTVLLVADTHTSRRGRREKRLARLLDALPTPDLAILAGDLLQGAAGRRVVPELVRRHVRARHGVYAVLGNAEHKIRPDKRRAFVAALTDAGARVLVNENEPLTIDGETITVAGTDDPYYHRASLPKTLANREPGRFTLLLAHSPQIAVEAARAGVDVMLSGHTHGGQVRLPLVGALKTQNPLGRKVDQGLFDRARLSRVLGRDPGGDLVFYITRGVGVARFKGLPLYPRLLCLPEVAWLTLRRGGA
jgi:hypothetical protein